MAAALRRFPGAAGCGVSLRPPLEVGASVFGRVGGACADRRCSSPPPPPESPTGEGASVEKPPSKDDLHVRVVFIEREVDGMKKSIESLVQGTTPFQKTLALTTDVYKLACDLKIVDIKMQGLDKSMTNLTDEVKDLTKDMKDLVKWQQRAVGVTMIAGTLVSVLTLLLRHQLTG